MGTMQRHRDHHSRQQPCLHPAVYLRCVERKAELPTLSQARPHPVHTHHTDVSSLTPMENKHRAWRPLSGTAACTDGAKSLVGELSIEPQSSAPPSSSYPLQGINVPSSLALWPAQFHIKDLLSRQSSQGTAASTLPTPGP